MQDRIEAEKATLSDGFWQLKNVQIYQSGKPVRNLPEFQVKTNLQAQFIEESFASADSVSFFELTGKIDAANSFGVTTGAVWQFTTQSTIPPALIAYEGFDELQQGILNGQGEANNGWQSTWISYTNGSPVNVTNETISYNNGDVQIDGGSKAVHISQRNAPNIIRRVFDEHKNGPIYFSLLVRRKAVGTENLLSLGLKAADTSQDHLSSAGIDFGYTGDKINAEVYDSHNSVRVQSSTTIANDTTYFIVSRIRRTGDNLTYQTSDILVNPSVLQEPASGWTSAANTELGLDLIGKFNVRTYFMSSSTDEYLLDELRIGTTYEAVVPAYQAQGTMFLIQ
jgi:hypothetical protein